MSTFYTLFIAILPIISLCSGCYRTSTVTTRAPPRPTVPTIPTVGPGTTVFTAFTGAGIVPDVLAAAPPRWLQISFGGSSQSVTGGQQLTPVEARSQPVVSLDPQWCDSTSYHTLVMVDPDVPSRAEPYWGEARHWLRVNVAQCQAGSGSDVDQYLGPGPDPASSLHRYVLLLYRQTAGILPTTGTALLDNAGGADSRINFKVQNFANRWNLTLVAGTYFMSEYNRMVASQIAA